MTDLREALDRMLLDEPPLPDSTERIIASGRRAERRQLTVTIAVGLAGLAATGGLVAVPLAFNSGRHAPVVLGTETDPSASPSSSGQEQLDPATGKCPDGQQPRITADLGVVRAQGTISDPGKWLEGYVQQHLEGVRSARFVTPSSVNGLPVENPAESTWAIITTANGAIATEYVVKASGNTWQAHPSSFVGCA